MSVLSPIVDHWDGENRRIYLKTGVTDYYPIEDLYHEYRHERRTNEDFRKWEPLLRAEGNVPKGAGAYTPRYVVLLNGTKIVPANDTLQINQLGDMITDNPDVDPTLYDISELTVPKPIFIKPSESETIQLNNESIVFSSFQGAVWYDANSIYSDKGSAVFPNGNTERPINDLLLAVEIANERGFNEIRLVSDAVIEGSDLDLSYKILRGTSHVFTNVQIEPEANVDSANFFECIVNGTLDGNSALKNCVIYDINYLNGHIHDSSLAGTITLGGNKDAYIANCSRLDIDTIPTINCGAAGQDLVMVNYTGAIRITNLSGGNKIGIGLSAGTVILNDSVTFGEVTVSGIGALLDQYGNHIETGTWNGGVEIKNQLISKETIATAVWDEPIADHIEDGSTGKALSTSSTGGVDVSALASAVWDESLTGANHNIPTSAGRRLRQVSSPVILDGIVVSSTINTITFNGDASSSDGAYDPGIIAIVEGIGAGQARLILEYIGSTKTAIVDRNWKVLPDNTSEYIITSAEGREHVNEGLSRGAGSSTNTILLNNYASDFDNAYNGQTIFLRSGTGEDQACKVLSYNGTTKEVTICHDWNVLPDETTAYVMLPTGIASKELIGEAVWEHESGVQALEDIARIKNIEEGNWKIEGTQMIFYNISGTELFRYNLFDKDNQPSDVNVYKREKV